MNIRKTVIFVFILVLFSTAFSNGGPTSYLPVSHRAYDFLERMEHHYLIVGAQLGTKPLTRAETAQLLFSLSGLGKFISGVDREELDFLLNEFRPDFQARSGLIEDDRGPVERMPVFLSGFLYRNRRDLYSARGDNYSLYVNPIIVRNVSIGEKHDSSEDDNVYTSGNGFDIHGTVGDHIGFQIDVRDSKEWGSREYPKDTSTTMPGRGYAGFKGDRAEFDETIAHIAYSNGPFVLSYGRGKNVWSRGKRGTFLVSGYASPYDMIRLETGFWKLKFMFFAAEIEQFPPIAKFYYSNPASAFSDSVEVKKRMSGHRIEINLSDRLNIGFHEAVIYGGRWDLSYLNPVNFLKGAEHNNGDHDNAVMGMDFRLFVHRSHSIYGEFFIDDITTSKLGTDWYGNKLAYQFGSLLLDPFGFRDSDMRLEYTRINPWVYTHRYPINSYTHYGDVLGHPAGPNSDELFMEFRKRFTQRFHGSLAYARRRHGKGAEIGGDPLEGFQKGYSEEAKFLAGDVEKINTVSFDLSYEVFWQFFVRAGYTREVIDGDGINLYRFSLGLHE